MQKAKVVKVHGDRWKYFIDVKRHELCLYPPKNKRAPSKAGRPDKIYLKGRKFVNLNLTRLARSTVKELIDRKYYGKGEWKEWFDDLMYKMIENHSDRAGNKKV